MSVEPDKSESTEQDSQPTVGVTENVGISPESAAHLLEVLSWVLLFVGLFALGKGISRQELSLVTVGLSVLMHRLLLRDAVDPDVVNPESVIVITDFLLAFATVFVSALTIAEGLGDSDSGKVIIGLFGLLYACNPGNYLRPQTRHNNLVYSRFRNGYSNNS